MARAGLQSGRPACARRATSAAAGPHVHVSDHPPPARCANRAFAPSHHSAGVFAAAREQLSSCTLDALASLALLPPKPPRCLSPAVPPASDGVWGGERLPGRVAGPQGHWSPVTVRAVGWRLPCIGTTSHICSSSRRSCVGAQVAGRRDASCERSSSGVLEPWSLATVCVTSDSRSLH